MARFDLVNNAAKSILKKLECEGVASHKVQKLRNPVTRISQMLEAVEVDRISREWNQWMQMVSNMVYEADDLLDEAATHVAMSKVHYRSFASIQFGWKMDRKIESICKKLIELAKPKTDRELGPSGSGLGDGDQSVPNPDPDPDPEIDVGETSGYIQSQNNIIVGRDHERMSIISALLDTTILEGDTPPVTVIVGVGGIGKTTLAKMVYNDERVADHFDLRLWVSVGDDFDIRTIISNIVTSCSPSAKSPIDGLRSDRLTALLHDKVFLLVLDDVWNEDREEWLSLISKLTVGARGSRILITSRSLTVADICAANHRYMLRGLSDEDTWCLFCRIAFGQQQPPKQLIHPVHKFLRHCANVPLAIVVGAGCLQSKNEDKQRDILERFIMNTHDNEYPIVHILEQIEQCYRQLPSPLKACFAYLSLFPYNFEVNTIDAISLWQAQGFLDTAAPELEDLGQNYCRKLAASAFLTDLKLDENGKLATFTMHDLLHDFAQHAATEWENIHVSLIHGTYQEPFQEWEKLRTFLCSVGREDADRLIDTSEVMKLSKFKSLRVLDLHSFGIQILPDSIANLIHLRYLDLSHNGSLVKLPNSITNLYNLQTLKLNFCYDLKQLPTNTRNLACLRRLEINGCDKLTFMPPGFEYLTSLQILPRYVVGRPRFQSTSGFQSLGNLNHLQGRLMIELSENWTAAVNDAVKSNLTSKTRLTELEIKWGPATHTSNADSRKHKKMLDGLQPPPHLKMLHIQGYRGPDFPKWAKSNTFATALPQLINVSIDGTKKCKTLPPFSRLPHLKHLTLRFMESVKFFENSESTSESQFFPTLEELTLQSFYGLERWCSEQTLVSLLSFNRLKKLKLWSCPKLKSMPLFPDVEVLDLQNFNKIILEVQKSQQSPSSSPSSLEATNYVPRGHPQNLSLLETLHVKGCPGLKSLALGLNSGKLKKLVVERLDMLSSLTEDLKQLTSLEDLEISSCKDLELSARCQYSCGTCDECIMPWKCLSKLRRLTLRELTQLATLPVGLQFIGTLITICISGCNNLSDLPKWISKFTSLQHLKLEGCLALSELPEELKDIKTLVKVDIIECPKLTERCRKGGKDWHKIEHARVLCHKSWRYALMSESSELPQKPKNQRENVAVHSEDPTIHVDVTVRRQPNRNI